MEEVDKKIAGDWFEIGENSGNMYDLEQYFKPTIADFNQVIADIRYSVEEGIIEYKRNILNPAFAFLNSMKFDSKGLESLGREHKKITLLMFVILTQRLIARGTIPLIKTDLNVETEVEKDLKSIVQDINSRIKENPEFANNSNVKNIQMQIFIYKKELEKMRTLAPNILPDKKESFEGNFRKTFATITASIVENYKTIIRAEEQKLLDSMRTNLLARYDLKPLSRILFSQVNEVSKIRSTLIFAEKEGFRTREGLMNLLALKEQIFRPFKEEVRKYIAMGENDSTARLISKGLGAEIIHTLEKEIKYLGGAAPSE